MPRPDPEAEHLSLPPALLEQRRAFLGFLERRVGDRDLAEDILQDSFAKAVERIDSVRDEGAVVAWFYRLLRNAVVDHSRRVGAAARTLDQYARELDALTEPDDAHRDQVCSCVRALVDTLNRHFAGRHTFRAARPDAWVMSSAPAALDSAPTAPAAGAFDPPGAPWTALFNEIQMALHEHPANEGRETEVNGVWLWGAGELPRGLSAPWGSVASHNPLVLGLARAAGLEHRTPPPSAAAWLAQAPEDGRHLVAPGELCESLDADWFAPLLAALKAGRVGLVTVHAPEEGLSVETARLDLNRFWRRPRPLAAHAHR